LELELGLFEEGFGSLGIGKLGWIFWFWLDCGLGLGFELTGIGWKYYISLNLFAQVT
jgi:hypothetical protein